MSKSSAFENDLLKFIFNNEAMEDIAESTDLYLALHTADPGEEGNQSTNEVEYGGYERVPVKRDATGWTVTGSSVSPTDPVEFPEMVSGAEGTATWVTIGLDKTGEGKVLYRGELTPPVHYVNGVVPRIRTTSTITED